MARVGDVRLSFEISKLSSEQLLHKPRHLNCRRAEALLGELAADAGSFQIHFNESGAAVFGGEADDFRCQAVTVFKTVRYQKIHIRTECTQAFNSNCSSSRAVCIVIFWSFYNDFVKK